MEQIRLTGNLSAYGGRGEVNGYLDQERVLIGGKVSVVQFQIGDDCGHGWNQEACI